MKIKYLIIGAFILLILLPLWYFAVVPEFKKIPNDYSFNAILEGTEKPNYDVGGISTEFISYRGFKENKVTKVNGEILEIKALFKAEELSGTPLFEISHTYGINKKNKEIVFGFERLGYLIPPTNLEKKNYVIQDPTNLVDAEFKFVGEEKFKGLEVYHFKAVAKNQDNTEGYEFLDLVPEKYNVEDDIINELWVEPKTGIIIDFKQDGKSNYIEDGIRIHQFTHYTNSFSDDTITTQSLKAQNERFKLLLINVIIPLLLTVAVAIITLFLSFKVEKKKGEAKK